jgi:hypothetical protein
MGRVRSNRFLQPQIEAVGQAFFAADGDGADSWTGSFDELKRTHFISFNHVRFL